MFKPVPSKLDFVEMERQILRFWKESRAFDKLRELRSSSPRFSFLDGPITANNPMGVHHAWGRTYKDLWQRYRAMLGYDQRWQNGFDCQGLWVEVNVEKDLGFKNKHDIEDYGLAEFVILCKQRVLQFAAVQTEQSIRLGQWMDWNDPEQLRLLREKLGENPTQMMTIDGPEGPVTDSVEQLIARLGLPELGGSYFTFSNENNYMIWSFLSKCAQNGWIYKGTDVMPWCARCGTGVSEHEISTEDYPDITHTSLTVRLPLLDRQNEYLLVWTTTPWTLTSNVAVAAGPDLNYVKVKQGDDIYYLSEGTQHMLRGKFQVLGKLAGKDMEGWTYVGPFDDLPAEAQVGGHVAPDLWHHVTRPPVSAAQAHRVIMWWEVSEVEGTGLVHVAPGCGAEDFGLSKEFGLPVVAPLDENGVFIEGFGPFSGMSVFDVAPKVQERLEEKGMLYRADPYTHRYPTCWRCKTELVFRLVDEWYISMGPVYDKPREELTPEEKARSLRYQIMDAVDQIRWIPGFGYEREMDWLRNMHDWMISKKRYWGLALPIWECDNCGRFTVVGSREELKERAVEGWDVFDDHTPHRPYVDAVKIKCENCGNVTSRIKDVGNPWLDAGIVPFSTVHFSFDPSYFEKWFPADFVTESFPGQFRNWFYSMLAMSTVMAHRAPFHNLLGYATLLAEDGRAMHKSLGNMIEFNEAADAIGSDVMRWMYESQRYDSNMLFGYHHADDTRRMFLLPLWNVYSFFVTYANLDHWTPDKQPPELSRRSELDRWIVWRLQEVTAEVREALEDYDSPRATRAITPFIDDLSNWYLRRSRRRFWKSEADEDKQSAYATLYEVLVDLVRLLAPFIPFITEEMYQNLVRSVDPDALESVHHTFYPEAKLQEVDQNLLDAMQVTLRLAALGRSARSKANVKLRQPLARAVVRVRSREERAGVERLNEYLVDELNVKGIEFAAEEGEYVDYRVNLIPAKLGPKYGKQFQQIKTAVGKLNPAEIAARVRAGELVPVAIDGETVELLPEELDVRITDRPGWAVAEENGYMVGVDTEVTPELEREGLARELVRQVQTMRKDAQFNIADRISTRVQGGGERVRGAVADFGDYVRRETLSSELVLEPPDDDYYSEDVSLDGERMRIGIKKV